jgi:F-type H+-transporting ATPase subunit a
VAAHHSPLAQFEVKTLVPLPHLFGYDISFTNASLFMALAVGAVMLFLGLGMRRGALVPSRFQSMAESSYEFIASLIKDNVGIEGMRYFPFIFTLFMFILFCNLFGMIPYSFTVTSHIIVTFALAATIFIGITLLAIIKHGPVKFLGYFLPPGVPMIMAPLMVFIEFFSYLARPVSLSVRLAANMMAGHTMLKVVGGFVIGMGILLGWAPLAFLIALTGFEFFVAALQAYIFTILTCVYLHDAIHLH